MGQAEKRPGGVLNDLGEGPSDFISYQIGGVLAEGHVGERPLAIEAETDPDLPPPSQPNPYNPRTEPRKWQRWELGTMPEQNTKSSRK